jgi:hypothetical protein
MLHSGEAIWQEIDQDPGGRRGDREEGDDDDGEEGGDTPDHVSNTLFGLILTGHQLCEVSCDGDEEKVIVLLSAQDAQSFINFQNTLHGISPLIITVDKGHVVVKGESYCCAM